MYPQRSMVSQAIGLVLLVTLVVLVLSACGGENQQQASKVRPPPEEGQALLPGEYFSGEFEPPLSFRVGEGWTIDLEMSHALAITQGEDTLGERRLLDFANVQDVYKPSRTGTITPEKAPQNMVGWFQKHPYLQTDKPKPVTVGGVKGVQFDVVVEDLPEEHFGVCGSDCVDLFRLSNDHRHVIGKGEKHRVIVLEDVKRETVSIVFASGATEFDE